MTTRPLTPRLSTLAVQSGVGVDITTQFRFPGGQA